MEEGKGRLSYPCLLREVLADVMTVVLKKEIKRKIFIKVDMGSICQHDQHCKIFAQHAYLM